MAWAIAWLARGSTAGGRVFALFGALVASRFYPDLHTALWISIAVLAVSALVSLPRMNVTASR